MSNIPNNPLIYHITHLNNLPKIIQDGGLWSDAQMIRQGTCTKIGMDRIKKRRLEECQVHCHPGTYVGEYVPFYFCPRSIMLYLIYRGNHPDLAYKGGQEPVIHLVSSLNQAVQWVNDEEIRWAFSDGNAGTRYTQFYNNLRDMNKINWRAVGADDWREPEIKEGKQAEFLVHDFFSFDLINAIGVINSTVQNQVNQTLQKAEKNVLVEVKREWYY